MASIATEVVKIISDIYGSVISSDGATLSSLDFTNQMLDDLIRQLNAFVQEKSNGAASVDVAEISMQFTVQNIIDVVESKFEMIS